MFERWKQRAAQRRAHREYEAAEQRYLFATKRYEAEHAAWDRRRQEIDDCWQLAKDGGLRDGVALNLKPNERAFLVLEGAALVEPKRLPGHWVGANSGLSFRVAKGVRWRVGGTRGTFEQGEEVPTPVDDGTVTITDQRVVFQGTKKAMEWSFAKLLGFQHDEHVPVTYLQLSNRQKVSGILYTPELSETVRLRLAVALAWQDGDASEVFPELERLKAEVTAAQPALPVAPGAPS